MEEKNTILDKTVSSSDSFDEDDGGDDDSDNGDDDSDDGDDDVLVTIIPSNDQPWFPFESKLQMYLYILIHSKTHTLVSINIY